ncbi:MAG TPA: ribosome maturation factor RimP [Syntrophobacteria bacterium]|nr:ribosome maturation factor RimP [Syntrophobacteria bacterium]
MAEALLKAERMSLVDLDYRKEGWRWVLRLFIDKEGGITVDDCAAISRELGDLLDAKDVVPEAYVLEVSSPGLNRRVRKKEDFSRFAGRKVEVRLAAPQEGRRKIVGDILRVEGEAVVVAAAEGTYTIALGNIAQATLVHEF